MPQYVVVGVIATAVGTAGLIYREALYPFFREWRGERIGPVVLWILCGTFLFLGGAATYMGFFG